MPDPILRRTPKHAVVADSTWGQARRARPPCFRRVHRATLLRGGVKMMAGVQYERIDDAGLHITVGGVAQVLEVDHVVICAGQDSLAELMPAEGVTGGPKFHKIGGAAMAAELDAKRAIREGAELAASF